MFLPPFVSFFALLTVSSAIAKELIYRTSYLAIDQTSSTINDSSSMSHAFFSANFVQLDASSDNSPTSGSTIDFYSRDKAQIAHGALGALSLLILTPIAVLIPRYFRGRQWFPTHVALQIASFVCIIITFILGVWATGTPAFTDNHTVLGLVISILFSIQVVFGYIAHRTDNASNSTTRFPTLARGKGVMRYLHMAFGISIIVIGWIQIHEGFDEWESSSDTLSLVPASVKVTFWVLVALWTALYAGGWILEGSKGARTVDIDHEAAHLGKVGHHGSELNLVPMEPHSTS